MFICIVCILHIFPLIIIINVLRNVPNSKANKC